MVCNWESSSVKSHHPNKTTHTQLSTYLQCRYRLVTTHTMHHFHPYFVVVVRTCKRIILVNKKVGEAGLNLQVANWVYMLSIDSNPAKIEQCLGRAARQGQMKTVYWVSVTGSTRSEENALMIREIHLSFCFTLSLLLSCPAVVVVSWLPYTQPLSPCTWPRGHTSMHTAPRTQPRCWAWYRSASPQGSTPRVGCVGVLLFYCTRHESPARTHQGPGSKAVLQTHRTRSRTPWPTNTSSQGTAASHHRQSPHVCHCNGPTVSLCSPCPRTVPCMVWCCSRTRSVAWVLLRTDARVSCSCSSFTKMFTALSWKTWKNTAFIQQKWPTTGLGFKRRLWFTGFGFRDLAKHTQIHHEYREIHKHVGACTSIRFHATIYSSKP